MYWRNRRYVHFVRVCVQKCTKFCSVIFVCVLVCFSEYKKYCCHHRGLAVRLWCSSHSSQKVKTYTRRWKPFYTSSLRCLVAMEINCWILDDVGLAWTHCWNCVPTQSTRPDWQENASISNICLELIRRFNRKMITHCLSVFLDPSLLRLWEPQALPNWADGVGVWVVWWRPRHQGVIAATHW